MFERRIALAGRFAVLALLAALVTPAHAIRFDMDLFGGISGTLNTTVELGAQWRMQERASWLIGKSNLDPNVCNQTIQGDPANAQPPTKTTCQGHRSTEGANNLFPGLNAATGEGPAANQVAVDAPGAFSVNHDDGNLNFDQYDLTQGVSQIKQDLELNWGDWTFFTRYLYFYDFENVDQGQFFPNRVTPNTASPLQGDLNAPTQAPGESLRIPLDELRNSDDIENLKGQSFRLLGFKLNGFLPLPFLERELQVTIGRQTINWGESTVLVVNSLNTINPPNLNALFQPGALSLDEVFVPTNAIKIGSYLTRNTSFGAFYQLNWQGAEIPAQGSFLSFIDVGLGQTGFLENGQSRDDINIGFGKAAEDPTFDPNHEQSGENGSGCVNPDADGDCPIGDSPFGIQRLEQTLLASVANSSATVPLLEPNEPSDSGQYGFNFTWFLPNFNNGTELRFYYANYHSRLPYVSFFAGQPSCARQQGSPTPALATDTTATGAGLSGLLQSCPDNDAQLFGEALASAAGPGGLPGPVADLVGELLSTTAGDGRGSDGAAYRLDSVEAQVEYPEDIELYGISFNTSFGDLSVQGEVAYRPNQPLQIDDIDLAFTALQPAAPPGCTGPGETCTPGSADDLTNVTIAGETVAQLSGCATAFPSFTVAYRGGEQCATQPGSYIQGFERFQSFQYNLGGTYIIGPGNWVFSDQIILVFEVGATHVPGLPGPCELQIEGPGTFTHASVGTDGTGTPSVDGVAQEDVCAPAGTQPVNGPSGVRFNPTQQKEGFATSFSWGYRIVAIIRYENILPGISIEPTVLVGHDVEGTAPGPGENFIEGRQQYTTNITIRYGNAWSATVGYALFRGADPFNLVADRDFFQLGLQYQF